jgi:hypothetical protein
MGTVRDFSRMDFLICTKGTCDGDSERKAIFSVFEFVVLDICGIEELLDPNLK